MAELRPYNPTWRDRLARVLMGNGRASNARRKVVSGLLGSTGLGSTGMSVADFTPVGAGLEVAQAVTDRVAGDPMAKYRMAMALMPGARAAKHSATAAKSIPYKDLLLAIHNTKSENLKYADKLGGLAVPSVAVTKPSQGFLGFGDISLVANKELVKPSRMTPVFGSDVYSPRFPSLNDEGTKIFRGFTPSGNRRYAPLNMDNLVREMRGNVRGGEGWNYGAGSVRATVAPQFKNLSDIQAARNKIVPPDTLKAIKEESNEKLLNLAEEFRPYYRFSKDNQFIHADDFTNMLAEMRTKGSRVFDEAYDGLPPELIRKAEEYRNYLRNLPTEYFEAKPQRAVSMSEFAGAVVPEDSDAATLKILEAMGFKRLEKYKRHDRVSQAKAFKKFRDLMFSTSGLGLLGAGAYTSSSSEPGA